MKTTIDNELRVIKKIDRLGGHVNIISMLRYGKLITGQHYLDMELCTLTLEEFIEGGLKSVLGLSRYFNPSSTEACKSLTMWEIIKHVCRGLNFLHSNGELHRDLKPSNGNRHISQFFDTVVLFSHLDCMWKIADFGLTTQGMSKRAATTNQSKGSAGYRAPELLIIPAIVHKKSDVFAMGCIIAELVSGEKMFPTDLYLYQYTLTRQKPSFPASPPEFDSRTRSYFHHLVNTTLEFDFWMRPKASEILELADGLSEDSTQIYVVSGESASSISRNVSIPAESDKWEKVS